MGIKDPNIDRLIATMYVQKADRVPNWEILIESRTVKYFLGYDAGNTLSAAKGIDTADENAIEPPMNPYDYIKLCNIIGQDAIGLESLWAPIKVKDKETGKIRRLQKGEIKGWEDIDRIVWPTYEADIKPRKEYIEEYIKATKGTRIGVFYLSGSFFQMTYEFILGFENFMYKIIEDRPFIEYLLDKCVEYYVKMAEIAVDAGISFYFFADDIAYKSGTFVRPDLFKEIWFPRALKILEPAKAKGIPIMFHSDGNLDAIMDDIILQLGINCLNPLEPYHGSDIYKYKELYGDRLCLSGNIDIAGVLAYGTPEEVEQDVKEHIERLAPGGGYILTSSHSITNDIPPENFKAMIDACHKYGVY